jgi:hypothetical protein
VGAERVMSGGRNNEEEAMARESISGSQFLLTLTLGGLLLTGCAKEVTVIESQVPPTVLRAFRAQYLDLSRRTSRRRRSGSGCSTRLKRTVRAPHAS